MKCDSPKRSQKRAAAKSCGDCSRRSRAAQKSPATPLHWRILVCWPNWQSRKNKFHMSHPSHSTPATDATDGPDGLRRPKTSFSKPARSEEHTSELQSPYDLVCRLLLEKKNR